MIGDPFRSPGTYLDLPPVSRARGCRLYTRQGGRYLDMYLDGGAALLGHRPEGLNRIFKAASSRGLWAPLPSRSRHQLEKAVLRTIAPPFEGEVLLFPTLTETISCLEQHFPGALLLDPLHTPAGDPALPAAATPPASPPSPLTLPAAPAPQTPPSPLFPPTPPAVSGKSPESRPPELRPPGEEPRMRILVWRPFTEGRFESLLRESIRTAGVDHVAILPLVPVPGWLCPQPLLVSSGSEAMKLQLSECAGAFSPALAELGVEAYRMLGAALRIREERGPDSRAGGPSGPPCPRTYHLSNPFSTLRESWKRTLAGWWKVTGPWLLWKGAGEEYQSLRKELLEKRILLPASSLLPSILPGEYSEGEIAPLFLALSKLGGEKPGRDHGTV